jgi:hypothetical protein
MGSEFNTVWLQPQHVHRKLKNNTEYNKAFWSVRDVNVLCKQKKIKWILEVEIFGNDYNKSKPDSGGN